MQTVIPKRRMERILPEPGDVIRRLLLAWLLAGALQYSGNAFRSLETLDSLAAMSFPGLLAGMAVGFAALTLLGRYFTTEAAERWGILLCFGWQVVLALCASFTVPFLVACLGLVAILAVYARKGAATPRGQTSSPAVRGALGAKGLTALFVALFLTFVCILTICRVLTFSSPTYDFGIFSQMFYNMRATGLPYTTCERDGLLSHFAVHVSPIYYLLLPFYALFPSPVTLQVLQALVLASAVIPLWLICRRHGLPPLACALLCGLLLFYPAYAGGTSYDLHENKFLTTLLLWLLYCIDAKKLWGVALSGLLTLTVKEDAPVYVAVVALYLLLRALCGRREERRWGLWTGAGLLVVSLLYFLAVTTWLAKVGDGVMTYRYGNFMYDGSDSLLTVVKAVLLSPLKAVFECADGEKVSFFLYTMLPLLFLPFLTRRYERLVLLIPYLLVNLMSDYQYQHSVFFQYTYGSTACLFYLTAVNLADLRLGKRWAPAAAGSLALAASLVCFSMTIGPQAGDYLERYKENRAYYTQGPPDTGGDPGGCGRGRHYVLHGSAVTAGGALRCAVLLPGASAGDGLCGPGGRG